jgi:YggT family protein
MAGVRPWETKMLVALIDVLLILLNVVWWIIIIQAILSWLVAFNVINTHNDLIRSFYNALDRLTRPLYNPIRRILPDFGGIDFSPFVVLILIMIVSRLLMGLQGDLGSGL